MLSKQHRVQLNEILFRQFQRSGKCYQNSNLIAYILPNNNDSSRFAVIVPKKLDKRSTRRNLTRRLVFEVVRGLYSRVKPGELVLIKVLNLAITKEEIEQLLVKAGIR